ncbi:MAG: mechanosensitive ion channel family protein [Bacillota bacterium]|nr:mechanosensitive ion channel family protein [Bacillota bacterium]
MFEWLNNEVYGTVTWLNLIIATLIFLTALVVSKLLSVQLRRSLKEKMSRENLDILIKVANYGILIIAMLWIMPTIGIEPSGLIVAGGIVALAVGFASQSIIGNLISGLFLMGERPVKIGDLIEISGDLGIVEDIHIISTTIRTLDGNFVRIPNETVFTSSITNYTSNPVRRFEYNVGISYADDADLAVKVIRSVIYEHPLALVNPAPQIFVEELGDNSVDIIVRVWAPATEWFGVKMELLWKFKQELDAAGIEIPFPQRVVWFGSDSDQAAGEKEKGAPA